MRQNQMRCHIVLAPHLLLIHRLHNRLPGYKATTQIICPEAVSLQNTVCHMPAQTTLTTDKISLSTGNSSRFSRRESRGMIAHQDIRQIVSVLQENEYQLNNNCPVPVAKHR